MMSMEKSQTGSDGNVVSLTYERNKRKAEKGRIANLAQMYLSREIRSGSIYAGVWLARELQIQGSSDIERDFREIMEYIKEEE